MSDGSSSVTDTSSVVTSTTTTTTTTQTMTTQGVTLSTKRNGFVNFDRCTAVGTWNNAFLGIFGLG